MCDNKDNTELKKTGKTHGVFYFKQFKVEDSRSTMKVGTDAVLLGAVVEVKDAKNILEIGTGCGVIALIMAQRSYALIDAIEIDEESARQAGENANNSRWAERIAVIHQSFQDFCKETRKTYDLIISNPPYFSRSLKSGKMKRNLSRHNDTLSFTDLLIGIQALLKPQGSCWVILPVNEYREFIDIANKYELYPHYNLKVLTKNKKPAYRMIVQLKKTSTDALNEELMIIRNDDNSYSSIYKEKTKEFYLDF